MIDRRPLVSQAICCEPSRVGRMIVRRNSAMSGAWMSGARTGSFAGDLELAAQFDAYLSRQGRGRPDDHDPTSRLKAGDDLERQVRIELQR